MLVLCEQWVSLLYKVGLISWGSKERLVDLVGDKLNNRHMSNLDFTESNRVTPVNITWNGVKLLGLHLFHLL